MFTLFWSVGMVGSIYEKTGRSTISSDCPFNVPLISVCRAGAEQPREQGAGWLLGPGHLPPHSWCGDQGTVFSDVVPVPTARATGICWHLRKHMYIFLLEFFSKAFYILIHFPSWIRTRIRIQYADPDSGGNSFRKKTEKCKKLGGNCIKFRNFKQSFLSFSTPENSSFGNFL